MNWFNLLGISLTDPFYPCILNPFCSIQHISCYQFCCNITCKFQHFGLKLHVYVPICKKKKDQVVFVSLGNTSLKQDCHTAGARHEASGTLLLWTALVRTSLVIRQRSSKRANLDLRLPTRRAIVRWWKCRSPNNMYPQTAFVVSGTELTRAHLTGVQKRGFCARQT